MTALWRLLIRPLLPYIEPIQQRPPVPAPDPGPEYREAIAQAEAARKRAEEIIAEAQRTPRRASKQTRPA